LHLCGIFLDGEDLMTQLRERKRHGAPEAAEADHDDVGAFLDEGISQ
jgi:hypothetical protein